MKLEFSQQSLEKSSNMKFHENSSSVSRVVPCDQTDGRIDIRKLIDAFRNFAKAPKNEVGKLKTLQFSHYQSIIVFAEIN